MRKLVGLALLAAVVSTARADWHDVKEGLGPQEVLESLGRPLIESRARHGLLVTWTYDNGGYVLFENGRVLYWQRPELQRLPLASSLVLRKDRRLARK